MDLETQDLLRGSIREILAGGPAGLSLDDALADLGWDEVVADDARAATTILFTEQGRALGNSRALDGVVLAGLDTTATSVIYPGSGAAGAATSHLHGDSVHVDGIALGALNAGETALVFVGHGEPDGLVAVSTAGLDTAPINGFDLDASWVRVSGQAPVVATVGDSELALRARAAAQRALASEITGTGLAALKLAQDHVSTRRQFGHTIASFQTVRFRLAEAWTWLAAAEAAIDAAWGDDTVTAAMVAKSYAGQAHRDVVAQCTQVCGAMGVTWEHSLHRYVRRGFVLDALLGSADELASRLGADALAGGEVVRLVAASSL
jgi:hypothetical protein